MKNRIIYTIFILLFCCQLSKGSNDDSLPKRTAYPPDSLNFIIDQLCEAVCGYNLLINEYTANLYTKGYIHIKKNNVLINYLPSMFRRKKGIKEYITESYSELHYSAPDIFDRKIKAYSGTIDKMRGFDMELMDLFDVNVYSNSLFKLKLISPLSLNARKYYRYKIDSIYTDPNDEPLYQISFTPKYSSFQLVDGDFTIDHTWNIHKLNFNGRSEYMKYSNKIEMGKDHTDSEYFVPVKFDSNILFHLLGNVIEGNFTIISDYDTIQLAENDTISDHSKNIRDLTKSFTLRHDTSTIIIDNNYFAQLRPIPLTEKEDSIYRKYHTDKKTDSIRIEEEMLNGSISWGDVGDLFVGSYTINSPHLGKVRFSPLLNPMSLSYSGKDGVSYKHKIRYQRLFSENRFVNIEPMFGYNFKHKEIYWKIPVNYEYIPEKRASFNFTIGNGNRIYSSEIVDEIKNIPDSIFDFNEIQLAYFRDFFVDFYHSIEPVNGLTIDVGISTHRRKAIETNDIDKVEDLPLVIRQDIEEIYSLRKDYVSFAPRLKVSWTPKQYYYKAGNRKINLYSQWPTFSFDYERGIKGVVNSTGEFERMELDMQHTVPLGLMRTLYYRVGCGIFTNKEELFFVDFRNFEKNNLPTGWNDDIGGTFQNLDRRWYNSSKEYLRGNLTFEAPFLLNAYIFKRLPHIINERIYLSALTMPHLNPYIEIGYGIGTHFFDFGMFVSNKNGKFSDFGMKITLELFNR